MERIKEAIEKAKSQSGVTRMPGQNHAEHPPVKLVKAPAQNVRAELDPEVSYSQTPVIKLDMAHLERHRIVAHQKLHPASWAFDFLRTQVLQKMDENGWRTLAITSPTMESGKTVVAINLAIGIAQQTNRTSLLVDFDLRRPRVASSLGLQREVSLNQVLTGPSSAEVLGSSRVAALMDELREHYEDRIVVVDLPPVLAADDVLALLPRVDCVLMVVGNGVSTKKEIEESMNRLAKFQLLGVVLNKDDAPVRNSYY